MPDMKTELLKISQDLKKLAESVDTPPVKDPTPPYVDDRPSPSKPGQKLLWYPQAIIEPEGLKMPTQGKYKYGYPQGFVVHYTAGHFEKGYQSSINTLKGGIKNNYAYLLIPTTGEVLQPFPMDRWGYHCGTNKVLPGLSEGRTHNDELIGAELNNAGKLEKKGDKFYTYWGMEIDEKFVRYADKKFGYVASGYYHMYTDAQEKALTDLILWMKANNPEVFHFKWVVGHDEISKSGKTDPGGSLSMPMPKYREYLEAEYQKRYGV